MSRLTLAGLQHLKKLMRYLKTTGELGVEGFRYKILGVGFLQRCRLGLQQTTQEIYIMRFAHAEWFLTLWFSKNAKSHRAEFM